MPRTATCQRINLAAKFASFSEHWSPKIVGELNGQYVKLARLKGEFIWHHHQDEDELFMVIQGTLSIRLRDETVTLQEGEFCIVPRGVEHCPVADEEVQVLLFEPKATAHTGNVQSDRSVEKEAWI